jgi:hypothetical protein
VKGTIKVAAASSSRPVPFVSPVAPVQAGGGGTAHLVAAEQTRTEKGPGAVHAVIGLVLAGAAATAVALRSVRRRSRGTD